MDQGKEDTLSGQPAAAPNPTTRARAAARGPGGRVCKREPAAARKVECQTCGTRVEYTLTSLACHVNRYVPIFPTFPTTFTHIESTAIQPPQHPPASVQALPPRRPMGGDGLHREEHQPPSAGGTRTPLRRCGGEEEPLPPHRRQRADGAQQGQGALPRLCSGTDWLVGWKFWGINCMLHTLLGFAFV